MDIEILVAVNGRERACIDDSDCVMPGHLMLGVPGEGVPVRERRIKIHQHAAPIPLSAMPLGSGDFSREYQRKGSRGAAVAVTPNIGMRYP
jgi:hypothetical protein